MDIPDIEMAAAVVTCHTEDCENAGIPIPVMVSVETGLVVCGPCGLEITDVVVGELEG